MPEISGENGAVYFNEGLTDTATSGTITFDSGGTGATDQTITLTVSTGTGAGGWTGSVIITGMDMTTPVDGVVTQSYSFQGTGKLSTV